MERKKAQYKFEEEWRLKEKQNKERQESLEKSWQEREQNLVRKENEFKELQIAIEQAKGRPLNQ